MKAIRIYILIFAVWLSCVSTRASTVIYAVSNFVQGVTATNSVLIRQVGYYTDGTRYYFGQDIWLTPKSTGSTNGIYTNQLNGGSYSAQFQMPVGRNMLMVPDPPILFYVTPGDTNTWYLPQLQTNLPPVVTNVIGGGGQIVNAGANITAVTNVTGSVTNVTLSASSSGSFTGNANQFGLDGGSNPVIKSGAAITNATLGGTGATVSGTLAVGGPISAPGFSASGFGFSGNGSQITGLTASQIPALAGSNITSGVVPSAVNVTGTFAGNVTGTQSATVVSSVGSAALPANQITGNVLRVNGGTGTNDATGRGSGANIGTMEMSAVGGDNYLTAMARSTPSFQGQQGRSYSGSLNPVFDWFSVGTGQGSNGWGASVAYEGGIDHWGSQGNNGSYFPNTNRTTANTTAYFLNDPWASTQTYVLSNGGFFQPGLFVASCNPWAGYAYLNAVSVFTNSAYGAIWGTNAEGTKLYMPNNQYGHTFGELSDAYLRHTNSLSNPESQLGPADMFSLQCVVIPSYGGGNFTIPGDTNVGIRTWVQTDPTKLASTGDYRVVFPFHKPNIWSITNPLELATIDIHEGTGAVYITNGLLTVTNLNVAKGAKVVMFPQASDDESQQVNINGNFSVNNVGLSNTFLFLDGAGAHRFALASLIGQFPMISYGNGAGDIFTIAQANTSDVGTQTGFNPVIVLDNARNVGVTNNLGVGLGANIIGKITNGALTAAALVVTDANKGLSNAVTGTGVSFDGHTIKTNGLQSSDFYSALTLAGSGASLTSLNGTQVTSGTVADARLSGNVPFLNASNVFTLGMSITSNVTYTTMTGKTVTISTSNIDASVGTFFKKTLSGNTPFLLSGMTEGETIQIKVANPSTFTVTWTGITWPSNAAPSLNSAMTSIISVTAMDGTNYGAWATNYP